MFVNPPIIERSRISIETPLMLSYNAKGLYNSLAAVKEIGGFNVPPEGKGQAV